MCHSTYNQIFNWFLLIYSQNREIGDLYFLPLFVYLLVMIAQVVVWAH